MTVKIRASDLGKLELNETDKTASVIQNIMVLLNTWKGSVPLYRGFGISSELMHKPVSVAKVLLISEIQEAIETYEPRAAVRSVSFEMDKASPSILNPTVEVEIL